MPRRNAVKAWQKLLERVETDSIAISYDYAIERVCNVHARELATRHWLEQLLARPTKKQRAKLIKALERRIAQQA